MNNGLIYFAEPIDFALAGLTTGAATADELHVRGFSVYRPKAAFKVSGTPQPWLQQINDTALLAAHGAVALLPSGTRTVGVPYEVGQLSMLGTPTLVISDMADASWVVASWVGGDNTKVVRPEWPEVKAGLDWLADRVKHSPRAMSEAFGVSEAGPTLTFGKTSPDAQLPTRGYATDAGFDLYVSADTRIPVGAFVDVPCGVSVDLPEGTWGEITGRSSTLRKRGLLVVQGVIDEEYTGELFAGVQNMSGREVEVKAGERISQLILHDAVGPRYQAEFGNVPTKGRGGSGFGSTGL